MPKQNSALPVLILGQGLAGSCMALELLSRNVPIKVVDAPWLSASSKVAAGVINPLIFKHYTFSWRAEHYYNFSINFFRRFGERSLTPVLHEKPLLRVFGQGECELWRLKAATKPYRNFMNISTLSRYNVLKLEFGAGEVHTSAWIDTARFLTGVRKLLFEKQAIVEQQWDYAALEEINGRVYFEQIEYQAAVFCEGYRAVENPHLTDVPFRPVKGNVLKVHIPELQTEHIISSKVFLVPLGDGTFKLGATYAWVFEDEKPDLSAREMLLTDLSSFVPVKANVLEHSAGIRPAIADRRPIAGRIPGYRNLFVINGLGSRGAMLAPPLANYVALLMFGRTAVDPELDLLRFARNNP
jgi:glycine/D-amino acid oxidase-like deaminating enzyme